MGTSPSPHDLFRHLTTALSGVGRSFARLRRWSPQSVIAAVLLLTRPDQRTSCATTLTSLAEESFRLLGWSGAPTKSSLSVARRTVPVATFRQALHRLVEHLSDLLPGSLRHHEDRRFIAVDATSLVCPRSATLLRNLSRPHVNPWVLAHYPRALVVVAFDVLRRLPLEWILLPKSLGERTAMAPLLAGLRRNDAVILDRGYPARRLLESIILDLYGRRWDIESLFREMKEAFTIERFHARTLDGIQQEIATVLRWIALTAVIHAAVQDGLTDGKRANRTVCREAARISLVNAIAGRLANIGRLIIETRRHDYKPRLGQSLPRESKQRSERQVDDIAAPPNTLARDKREEISRETYQKIIQFGRAAPGAPLSRMFETQNGTT